MTFSCVYRLLFVITLYVTQEEIILGKKFWKGAQLAVRKINVS